MSLNDVTEQRFVNEFYDDVIGGAWRVWLGLTDHAVTRGRRHSGADNDEWVWEDGSRLTADVASWSELQPNLGDFTIAVAMQKSSKTWHNANPRLLIPFMCEYVDACARNVTSCHHGGVCVSVQLHSNARH